MRIDDVADTICVSLSRAAALRNHEIASTIFGTAPMPPGKRGAGMS